jgi:hypothetical protein
MGAKEYRQNAAACLRIASLAADPELKAVQTDMAQAWTRLADLAEKNSHLDLIYEPPPVKIERRDSD